MKRRSRNPKYKVTRVSTKVNQRKRNNSMSLAIISVILNFLVIPGLGSLIGGKTKPGVWQMILFLIGAIGTYFFYNLFGIVVFVAWIWGVVTGIKMIQEAR